MADGPKIGSVPPGQLAAVVTHLEMLSPPPRRAMPQSELSLVHWKTPELAKYRTLFNRVGAPWLWYSRLLMSDAAVTAIIADRQVEVRAATDRRGIEVGMLELDFRKAGQCEIAYFALIPALAGKGNGGWLMALALQLAWRKGVERVWVHTCTLDHPAALPFYQRQGFTPFAREIETFPDPRLHGYLSEDCAAREPLIR